MSTNQQVLDVFEEFVQKLEAYMGVKRTLVDFSSLWMEKAPHQSTETFDEYFLKVCVRYDLIPKLICVARPTNTYSTMIPGTTINSLLQITTKSLDVTHIFLRASPIDGKSLWAHLRSIAINFYPGSSAGTQLLKIELWQ